MHIFKPKIGLFVLGIQSTLAKAFKHAFGLFGHFGVRVIAGDLLTDVHRFRPAVGINRVPVPLPERFPMSADDLLGNRGKSSGFIGIHVQIEFPEDLHGFLDSIFRACRIK